MIRAPRPALQPFIRRLWIATTPPAGVTGREHSLPADTMHLVMRLSGGPVRLFEHARDSVGCTFGHSVAAGLRGSFYVKEVPASSASIGVEFHPTASEALLGVPAEDLAGRHGSLQDLWGASAVDRLRDRLLTTTDGGTRLDILEEAIAVRMPRLRGVHPAVALALERFRAAVGVEAVVRESGYSHRTVAEQFRRAMGLGPKAYLRLLRMRGVLARIGTTELGRSGRRRRVQRSGASHP